MYSCPWPYFPDFFGVTRDRFPTSAFLNSLWSGNRRRHRLGKYLLSAGNGGRRASEKICLDGSHRPTD